MIFSKFDMSQNIQLSNIICNNNNCPHDKQGYWGNFYKCLSCGDINDHSKYFCNDCKDIHDKTHVLIKYNIKDFYCEKKGHYEKFSHYCPECKKDLCVKCLRDHRDINIVKKYDQYVIKIKDIKDNLNLIESKIKKLRNIVEDIKLQLEMAMKIMEKYYSISKDIIEKYEKYNETLKNHRIIFSIKNIKESNEEIKSILNEIMPADDKKKDIKKIFIKLIDLYHDDRMEYMNSQPDIITENKNGNGNSTNKNNPRNITQNRSNNRLSVNKKNP